MKIRKIFKAVVCVLGVVWFILNLAHAQSAIVNWSTFDMGYASSTSANSALKSVVGQVLVENSQQGNTLVQCGLLFSIPSIPTDVKDARRTPAEFRLEQNYPNPFNPSTTLQYELPVESKVSLKVYNILGQVVVTLEDGIEQAGYKQAEWNAANYGSGVYFYRLVAVSVADANRRFTQIRKMILLK